jgi:hypothetical protein
MDAYATSASTGQLWTLTEARVVIEDYRCQYNHYHSRKKLGYKAKTFRETQSVPSPAPVAPGSTPAGRTGQTT